MYSVFIDGSHGTTGLRIYERLQAREDIKLCIPSEADRKDPRVRKELLHSCDIAFLCLPDSAAKESVELAKGSKVKLLDTSTAHRTAPGWTYGFPELGITQKEDWTRVDRVAVPGCHASGFVALVAPLVKAGYLASDALLSAFSLTGYSGGGKPMIADYQSEARDPELDAPRQYGLTQMHKHLPEMQKICGLALPPVFSPIVADYYSGMEVTVPLHRAMLAKNATVEDLLAFYEDFYAGSQLVKVKKTESAMLSGNTLSMRDDMELTVCGNEDRLLLISRFDNLGKGASGAAIECMNLMLGLDAAYGLQLGE